MAIYRNTKTGKTIEVLEGTKLPDGYEIMLDGKRRVEVKVYEATYPIKVKKTRKSKKHSKKPSKNTQKKEES